MSDLESLLFYIAIITISTFFFSLYKNRKKLVQKIGVSLSILIPTIVAGCRYDVGTDYLNYDYIFSLFRNMGFEEVFSGIDNVEWGFKLLSKLLTMFFDNKIIFALITFLTLTIYVYTLLKQYGEYNLTLCYVVFLFLSYTTSLNILRQYIALVIVFYALQFVLKNQLLKFIFFVLIATMFHTTSILAIPIWFLWNHKENKNITINIKFPVAVVSMIVLVFWPQLLTLILKLNIPFISKYASYLMSGNSNNMTFYVKLGLLIIMLFSLNYLRKYDYRIEFFINMYLVGAIIEFVGFYSPFIKRIGLYYTFPKELIICMLPLMFKQRDRKIINVLIVFLVTLYFTLSAFILKQADIIPYKWE